MSNQWDKVLNFLRLSKEMGLRVNVIEQEGERKFDCSTRENEQKR